MWYPFRVYFRVQRACVSLADQHRHSDERERTRHGPRHPKERERERENGFFETPERFGTAGSAAEAPSQFEAAVERRVADRVRSAERETAARVPATQPQYIDLHFVVDS